MIEYRMASLRVAEFHFDEAICDVGSDVIRYRARTEPMSGVPFKEQSTIVVNLVHEPDVLWANMNKSVRYEIRRAAKDSLTYLFSSSPVNEWIGEFAGFFNRFATSKGIHPANVPRLNALRTAGCLDMSRVCSQDGDTLVWHVYIRTHRAVRFLYSASQFRETAHENQAQLIGRANRYQHWMDMLRFREQGVVAYDLGGWYSGSEDEQQIRINQFKSGFGGEVVQRFNGDYSLTWKGAVALKVKKAPIIQRAVDLLKFRHTQ